MTEPTVRMHVGDAVVARVAAQRARRVPGVVALRADLAQALLGLAEGVLRPDRGGALPTDGVYATVQGDTAEVLITLATRLGYNCRDLTQEVQRQVVEEVRGYTGLEVTVRVTVADVLHD